MQKIYKILLVMMMFAVQTVFVKAATLSTSILGSSTVEVNGEIVLTFAFESDEALKQLSAQLDFDGDLLEIVGSPSGLNGFNVVLSAENEIIATLAEGSVGTVSFMSIRFKAKEMFTIDGTVNVSLSNVRGTLVDSDEVVSGNGSSKLITSVAPKSSNNYLADLSTNVGNINF
ncbi:MAG: hypothetical protein KMY54_03015, partial [Erysipelothrix sp.]|nr:hypothetical protein [Erysipelothrix sp.]